MKGQIEGPASFIRLAHSQWEKDCKALEWELSELGLGFGSNGYKLALERGAHRLEQGVTAALAYVAVRFTRTSDKWQEAHRAILEAVDRDFMGSSRLIAAPGQDPILSKVAERMKQRVGDHCATAAPVFGPVRLILKWLRTPR